MAKPRRNGVHRAFIRGPGSTTRAYLNKDVIYSQDESARAIFYVKSGLLKLTRRDGGSRRKHAVLALLSEGTIFGESCLLPPGARRMSTVVSVGSSTVACVERAVFLDRIKREPALAVLFIRHLISQSVLLKMDLADHRLNAGASEKRLARILLACGSFAQESTTGPSTRQFSQATLADIVGTTRSRVNGFMNKFRKAGYVHYNGGLTIDAEKLMAFLRGAPRV